MPRPGPQHTEEPAIAQDAAHTVSPEHAAARTWAIEIHRALGVLMERFGLTPHQSRDRLRFYADLSGRPLHAVAHDVVSGELWRSPEPAPERREAAG